MDDLELKNIWKAYDQKLEEARVLNLQSWVLNFKAFEAIQTQKAKSKLNALARFKTWIIVAGIAWEVVLAIILYHSFAFANLFFTFSIGIIALFNLLAIVVYVKHVVLIREIDNTETVIDAQRKTAQLQSSTLWIVRVLFLQMPFYATCNYSLSWIKSGDIRFWMVVVPITLLLTFLSIWLYRNINYKNVDKKWFRVMFYSPEWTTPAAALRFLKEIDDFKNDSG